MQSFGSGAMTSSTKDIGDARCILAIGTNTTAAHPIVALQVMRSIRQGGKLIVVNPREIELARHADLYIQHRPGSDVALLMGMMRVIVDEGLHDPEFIEARCENFEAFRESLAQYDDASVEEKTGVPFGADRRGGAHVRRELARRASSTPWGSRSTRTARTTCWPRATWPC